MSGNCIVTELSQLIHNHWNLIKLDSEECCIVQVRNES